MAGFLWRRSLSEYPDPGWRYFYLVVVIVVTIILYYELYIQYAVAPSVMEHFGMSFRFFIWIAVIGNAVGAFASLLAGLADRWGRANLTVYGLLVVCVMVLLLPSAETKYGFLIIACIIYFVEGIVLVATPALIRDFSPQVGRASAMGFWTMGPVLGSLVVTLVTAFTLGFTNWQGEMYYAGFVGLAVFLLALFGLRELSPRIRNQIMVSLRDRKVVEARARQATAKTDSAHLWRRVSRPGVFGPAFGISVFLMLYYAAVGNLVIYFVTTFHYTEQAANSLATWYWGSNAIALVCAGIVSDKLRVRKPFMLAGAIGSIVITAFFALSATHPETSFATFIVLFVFIGITGGFTYAPWMAGFTETVESVHPAATAIGLAIWAWILRIVVAASAACLPLVVTSVTPLIEHGAEVVQAQQKAAPALKIVSAHPKLFHELSEYPPGDIPPRLQARAVQTVGKPDLAVVQEAQPQLEILEKYGRTVARATRTVPGQWQTWWWICLLGQVAFLPFIFLMVGRWRPSVARKDHEAHERAVARELALLKEESRD